MKTTITRNQAITLGAVAAVAVVGLGSAVHSASVREQNCLSYERQIQTAMSDTINLMNKLQSMNNMVQENPFAAFGMLGEMGGLVGQAEGIKARANDLKYAYVGTCSAARFDKFVEKPEVKAKVDTITSFQF